MKKGLNGVKFKHIYHGSFISSVIYYHRGNEDTGEPVV